MNDERVDHRLRTETLERALERRAPGRAVDAPEPSTPVDAARAAVDQLYAVLTTLGAHEWQAPAHDDIGTVRDLVTHLLGIERLVPVWVADDDLVPTDHLAASRAAAGDVEHLTTSGLAAAWFDAARAAIDACEAADPARPVMASDLPSDVEGLLVLRAFELWSHTMDVCAATGRPAPAIDAARLVLMSSRLMGALPGAFALRAVAPPVGRVRFVLTGDGGGCYDVDLGDGSRSVTVVADTTDVCKIAARRLAPDALDHVVDGDEDDADAVLAVLDAFARD
jgi:uncharacterized protein (TIGR03083 family)